MTISEKSATKVKDRKDVCMRFGLNVFFSWITRVYPPCNENERSLATSIVLLDTGHLSRTSTSFRLLSKVVKFSGGAYLAIREKARIKIGLLEPVCSSCNALKAAAAANSSRISVKSHAGLLGPFRRPFLVDDD